MKYVSPHKFHNEIAAFFSMLGLKEASEQILAAIPWRNEPLGFIPGFRYLLAEVFL